MPKHDDALFIITISLENSPFFTLYSRFVQEDLATRVKHTVTCHHENAAGIYLDASMWTRLCHGSISIIRTTRDTQSFSIVVPIVLAEKNKSPGLNQAEPEITRSDEFFLADSVRLFWTLARLRQNRHRDISPTINLEIKHPPFFIISSQFILDDDVAHVQHLLTCQQDYAADIYSDGKSFARYLRGAVSYLEAVGAMQTFSVTMPIIWQKGGLESEVAQPGAYFLANAQLLFWWLARPLQQRRIRDSLRRRYGPKNEGRY